MASSAPKELPTAGFPPWLTLLSWASLLLAGVLATVVLVDVLRRRRPMGVMNVVWPLTMLFGSLLWYLLYRRRARTQGNPPMAVSGGRHGEAQVIRGRHRRGSRLGAGPSGAHVH